MIVLNYHGLSDEGGPDKWSLSRSEFESHFSIFGKRIVSPSFFLEHCNDPGMETSRGILLTFDDAIDSDFFCAFPKLIETGFVSFVPTAIVGMPGRMTWKMIEEMHAAGVMIGSHGVDHVDFTRLDQETLLKELTLSKRTIEDRLGTPIRLLAFPYGKFNRRVWETALDVGYTHLFTIQLGWHNGFEDFLFSRLCMTRDMSVDYLNYYVVDPCNERNLAWRISSKLGLYRSLMRLRFR